MRIWRLQAYLIRVGYTIEDANAKIIDVYGTDKITPLTVIISNDQKRQDLRFIGHQRFRDRIIVNTN